LKKHFIYELKTLQDTDLFLLVLFLMPSHIPPAKEKKKSTKKQRRHLFQNIQHTDFWPGENFI